MELGADLLLVDRVLLSETLADHLLRVNNLGLGRLRVGVRGGLVVHRRGLAGGEGGTKGLVERPGESGRKGVGVKLGGAGEDEGRARCRSWLT